MSPSGSNSHTKTQAQSTSTPWQTITYAASQIASGDTVSIMTGTYREMATLPVASSGTAAHPTTFTAYSGPGTVTISGTKQLTSWTSYSPTMTDVWYTTLSTSLGTGNQVFVSSAMKPEARWPNPTNYPMPNSSVHDTTPGDWSYMTSAGYGGGGANGYFADSSLPTRANGYWNGAIVHGMDGYGWFMTTSTVTGYTDSTKTITTNDANGNNYPQTMTAGNEYYLSGVKGEMDSTGEWFYEPSTSRLYIYSTSRPTNVEAKQRDYGLDIAGCSYVNVTNLNFFGCTIESYAGTFISNCVFNGLNMKYTGFDSSCGLFPSGSSVFGLTLGNNCVLENSTMAYDSIAFLQLAGSNISVINNIFHDCGFQTTFQGALGGVSWVPATNNYVCHNTMYNVGRNPMTYVGGQSIIEYNDIYNGMAMATDGGLFYSGGDAQNTIFRYNKLHDSPGPNGHYGNGVQGFYLDNGSDNWIIHHNLIWNIAQNAFQFNFPQDFNMVFNNSTWSSTTPYSIVEGTAVEGQTGNLFYNNLFDAIPKAWALIPGGDNYSVDDLRYNLYYNPSYTNAPTSFQLQSTSPGVATGTPIPDVTDAGNTTPDMGALQTYDTNWSTTCGEQATLSPWPSFSYPAVPYANQMVNGGFETGVLAPWAATGGSSVAISSSPHIGAYSAAFSPGTSEINETVTGLQPNQRYTVYGTFYKDSLSTASVGVRNFGQVAALQASCTTNLAWQACSQSFTTGPSTTSVQVYVDVTVPSGDSTPVRVDDVGVVMTTDYDPMPAAMPTRDYTFNESSGATAHDVSTNAQNGTVSGTAVWGPGEFGNALTLDGSTTSVTCPPLATPTGDLTVSLWAKNATNGPWEWTPSNTANMMVADEGCFAMQTVDGTYGGTPLKDVVFTVYVGGTTASGWLYGGTGFDNSQWHNYTGVYSKAGATVTMYVDGSEQSSYPATGTLGGSSGNITIGHDPSVSSEYLHGAVDDIRIYNSALTANQISALCDLDQSKLLHLKMDDGSGTTAYDNSGWGEDGVFQGSPAPSWTTGITDNADPIEDALSYNGTTSYVLSPPLPVAPAAVTVSSWVKSNTSTWNDYVDFVDDWPAFKFEAVSGSNNLYFYVNTGGTTNFIVSNPPVGFDITQWHLYTATYDPATQTGTIYVDGQLNVTGSWTGAGPLGTNTGSVYVGKGNLGSGRILNGLIDDVRVYDRPLPWNQVLDLYNDTNGTPY